MGDQRRLPGNPFCMCCIERWDHGGVAQEKPACLGCDWQVLLHRCCSSESNQLGYLWSGNPELGVSSFFSLAHPLLKEVVEPFWSPFSFVSCSEEFGDPSLDTSALSLLCASNSKPSFSGVT
ncbi:hypothetical protein ATANTOWER_012605 [Ataeniobius toweri]|uniref:Uncharacterized protein n=1 Tax=Ataeniobius toweri TaxID=208326 RepID=A0ABU7BYS6_9TELE|nr:hypothetical protein [Ataeniobius toweri]